jgi:aromatic ring hydroxylase
MLASFVDHLRDQHSVIRQYLQELRETPAQHDAFPQVVHRLDEAFDLHVDEEESRAFAYATEHLAGELDALAVEMEHQQDSLRGAYGVG